MYRKPIHVVVQHSFNTKPLAPQKRGKMRNKIIISLAGLALAFLAGWLVNGWRMESRISKMQAEQAQAIQLAKLKEQTLQEEIDHLIDVYQEEKDHANKEIAQLRADVAVGRVRLSVPARCHGTGTATGAPSKEARAELDAETADALIAIAADGDDAIRELNLCLDAYAAEHEK